MMEGVGIRVLDGDKWVDWRVKKAILRSLSTVLVKFFKIFVAPIS